MAGSRSVGSAVISWGLVSIPVKAYLTASADGFSFNMITPAGNRVKQKLVDAVTGDEVKRSDCVSGYEVEKGKYVTFTDEELDALAADKSNSIEMLAVTDKINLSPAFVEKALYLSPDKSDKSYKLLNRCLREDKKVAVCKWYSRGKDHLVAIAAVGEILMMFQLYYKSEIREFDAKFGNGSDPTDKEVSLGKMLLAQLSVENFDLGTYKDEFAGRVEAAIATKQGGGKIESVKEEVRAAAFDLAALLESSLNAKK